jgi:superfamily II DNA helicase RecQ
VSALTWPLGRTGLATTLKGSIDAPPSAQSSAGFGVLGAATPGAIKKWIDQLIDGGHLIGYTNENGYKLLRVGNRQVSGAHVAHQLPRFLLSLRSSSVRSVSGSAELTSRSSDIARQPRTSRAEPPHPSSGTEERTLAPADQALFEELRRWRTGKARARGVSAFVILTDRTLREIAVTRPSDENGLAQITGVGPNKTVQYGEDILGLVQSAVAY